MSKLSLESFDIIPIIFYSSMLFNGIADGLWKRNIMRGVIMTIVGLASAYTIMNIPNAEVAYKLIQKYHLQNLFKFINLLVLITFVVFFFKRKDRVHFGNWVILLFLLSVYCILNGIKLDSFWLGIGAIGLGIGTIGAAKYLWFWVDNYKRTHSTNPDPNSKYGFTAGLAEAQRNKESASFRAMEKIWAEDERKFEQFYNDFDSKLIDILDDYAKTHNYAGFVRSNKKSNRYKKEITWSLESKNYCFLSIEFTLDYYRIKQDQKKRIFEWDILLKYRKSLVDRDILIRILKDNLNKVIPGSYNFRTEEEHFY